MTIIDSRVDVGSKSRHAHALRTAIGGGTRLYVGEVDDVDYVTNSYWLAPLTRLSVLWDGTPAHGTWELEANAKGEAVKYVSESAPRLNTIVMPEQINASQEIRWADLDGKDVYTADGAKMFYRDNACELEAINLDYVRTLAGEKFKYSDTWDDSVWRIVVPAGSAKNKPVTVQRPALKITSRTDLSVTWMFAGIVMPVRVS